MPKWTGKEAEVVAWAIAAYLVAIVLGVVVFVPVFEAVTR